MKNYSGKFEALVIGELNVDIILNDIEGFPTVGKEIICADMNLVLGSSSAIFASNLSSIGTRVGYIGKLGKDNFSRVVLEGLESAGVDTSGVIRSASLNTGATIVMNYGEDRAMLTYPGAMNSLCFEDINLDVLKNAKHLHFSSFFLQPGIQKEIARIFQIAKESGLTTSMDPQWDPSEKWDMPLDSILPWVDVFMPNKQELLNLTSKNSIPEAIQKIKNYSHALIIKDGSQGAWLWNGKEILFQKSFLNTHPVDCIGAGDSFNAGFIHKFVNGKEVEKCMEFGAIMGALSTTEAGGTKAFENPATIRERVLKKFNFII
jgi:sugar/nucleoside kinase (ribokinase family)